MSSTASYELEDREHDLWELERYGVCAFVARKAYEAKQERAYAMSERR
jgi:hypothetical protein